MGNDTYLEATSFERLVYMTLADPKQHKRMATAKMRELRNQYSKHPDLVSQIRAVAREIYCQIWPTWPSAFLPFTGLRTLDVVNTKCEHVFGRCVCSKCNGKGQAVMSDVLTELRGEFATLKSSAVAALA